MLLRTIQEINTFFSCSAKVNIVSNIFRRQEYVLVQFEEDALNSTIKNYMEREYVSRKLFDSGYSSRLSEEKSIEIEKVMKYVFKDIQAKISYGKNYIAAATRRCLST